MNSHPGSALDTLFFIKITVHWKFPTSITFVNGRIIEFIVSRSNIDNLFVIAIVQKEVSKSWIYFRILFIIQILPFV